jgi:16S rRNA (uracil1498-N3)-methyltransferase
MRIPRIYTDQPLQPNQDLTLEPEASRHLLQVLRLRTGAELVLFNGDGCNYAALLESISKKQASAKVLSGSDPEQESPIHIHLCIAVSKGERMDFAIQKSVELGVSEITPLFSQHGVVNLKGERLEKRLQHWRKVIISACEQSGRCRLPVLNHAIELDRWIDTPPQGTGLILDPNSKTSIGSLEQQSNKINLLVGPEGGLSQAEITAAENSGFNGICMGPRILRTETAPIAAIAAIQTLWGDFC